MFKPLINSLFDAVPVAWDMYSNFIYRLVTGSRFEDNIEILEGDIIETENMVKYEYIPVEEIKDIEKDRNVIKFSFIEGEKEGIKSCIGYDIEDKEVVIDILDGHILIGGMTGGGKSNLLNVMITNILKTYTSNEVILGGCDYAESDIYYFRKYEHFKNIGVSTNKEAFLRQIKYLEDEMKRRASVLEKANCRNAINYNKKYNEKMTYIVFIIDELVQLVDDNFCKKELHRIMSKCRKYGIFFVLGGQDATKEIIGRCKMNCPQTIGFKTYDATDSDTLIGKGQNLQDITIVGRCKVKNKKGIKEVQVMYLEEEEMEELLKDNLKG